jgi:ABC-type glutathione transport system ATPase component
MTSASPAAASILVSCQQTRFHLIEDNASKEVCFLPPRRGPAQERP